MVEDKDLLSFDVLSIVLTGKKGLVRKDKIPKKYQPQINELLEFIKKWKFKNMLMNNNAEITFDMLEVYLMNIDFVDMVLLQNVFQTEFHFQLILKDEQDLRKLSDYIYIDFKNSELSENMVQCSITTDNAKKLLLQLSSN